MRKIPEILLLSVLRRYPLPARLTWFTVLGRYAWLKDILDELYPELFPQPQETEEADDVAVPVAFTDPRVLGVLDDDEIQGRQGRYKAEKYLGARGNGHVFTGIETISKQPVTIKEYLLLGSEFTKTEAYQRQYRFEQVAGLHLADGRSQDFRVLQPIEAIADTASHERCFLISARHDQSPTLRYYLQQQPTLSIAQVQEILSQILQTLDFLHNQKFMLPSGAIQHGVVHGNLTVDSVLWVEQQGQPFVYLSDLLLWEQCFDLAVQDRRSPQVTPETLQQDLQAVGAIGLSLLQTIDPEQPAPLKPELLSILDGLGNAHFNSADAARQTLLALSPRTPKRIGELQPESAQTAPKRQVTPLLILLLMGFVVGAFFLVPRLRSKPARSSLVPQISTCCLTEVSAVPSGQYIYTSVKGGAWWSLVNQKDLLQRGQSFDNTLLATQPNLTLDYAPAFSIEEALDLVRSGDADFAILPLLTELPSDLSAQEIAYDGLAVVVSFSYAERQQGLPAILKGQLTLDQVKTLYEEPVNQWREVGGPRLRVQRYISENPEAIAVIEQRLLQAQPLDGLPDIQTMPSLDLLRQIIYDFEVSDIGAVGLTTISELWGQCSVYPLALSQKRQAAVQPLILSNGQDISPQTNLCTRKGAYGPDPKRFQLGQYPLSYSIAVVYPRDNRRSIMGKKFIELMHTIEGQELLRAAGLIPLSQALPKTPTSPTSP